MGPNSPAPALKVRATIMLQLSTAPDVASGACAGGCSGSPRSLDHRFCEPRLGRARQATINAGLIRIDTARPALGLARTSCCKISCDRCQLSRHRMRHKRLSSGLMRASRGEPVNDQWRLIDDFDVPGLPGQSDRWRRSAAPLAKARIEMVQHQFRATADAPRPRAIEVSAVCALVMSHRGYDRDLA